MVFSIEDVVSQIGIHTGIRLYGSLVEPHLLKGCAFILDDQPSNIERLEKVQRQFLRKLLGLCRDSMIAALFTETGVIPMPPRRIIIALRFVAAILTLDEGVPAKHALRQSIAQAAEGKDSFYGRFLAKLAEWDVTIPSIWDLDQKMVQSLSADILRVEFQRLHQQVEANPKAAMLIRDSVKRTGPRQYLQIANKAHRRALVRLLFGESALADELGRYTKQYAAPEERWCRLCSASGTFHHETGLALIFDCQAPMVAQLRNVMIQNAGAVWQEDGSQLHRLNLILDDAIGSKSLAAFVFRATNLLREERWSRTDWNADRISDDEALISDSDDEELV